MAYLQSMRGDYLSSARGDPFFHGKIVGGIIGAAKGAIGGALAGIGLRGRQTQSFPGGLTLQMPQQPLPGWRAKVARVLPGGATGMAPANMFNKDGSPRRIRKDGQPYKRPSMNAANPRALRRAMRREDSFVKLAKRALKGSKYRIVSGSASRRQPSMRIMESGPGGVTVQH